MPTLGHRSGAPVGRLFFYIRMAVALAVAALVSVPLLTSSSSAVEDPNQVVICKYSHTPVIGEVAQTVIITNTSSLDGTGFAGVFPFTFSDQQNSSVAIRFAEVGENTGSLGDPADVCPLFGEPDDECPNLDGVQPPGFQCEADTETQTRDVGPLLDCDAGTVTTLHQERTRTQEFVDGAWVWGDWSEWVTVGTDVEDATSDQCPGEPVNPPPPPPPPNPPTPTPPTPVLPNTGSGADMGGMALLSGLLLAAGSALLVRRRKLGATRA